MNKLHTVNITKKNWRLMIRLFWIIGVIILSLGITLLDNNLTEDLLLIGIYQALIVGGSISIGVGFGLVYARAFNIKGIDTKEE
jgi:hypothetical protein